ncbi:hypothetical protein Tco_0765897 [Tanacetum coccineum]
MPATSLNTTYMQYIQKQKQGAATAQILLSSKDPEREAKCSKHKWTNPESTNARRNRFRVTDEEPGHFGDDALPRPPWLQRIAKSQRSGSNSTASSGSNPMMYQQFMKEQYELDRKAKMQESEERRQFIHAQRIAEEIRVLQIVTRGMDPADAVIINAQKARIRAAYQPPPN